MNELDWGFNTNRPNHLDFLGHGREAHATWHVLLASRTPVGLVQNSRAFGIIPGFPASEFSLHPQDEAAQVFALRHGHEHGMIGRLVAELEYVHPALRIGGGLGQHGAEIRVLHVM